MPTAISVRMIETVPAATALLSVRSTPDTSVIVRVVPSASATTSSFWKPLTSDQLLPSVRVIVVPDAVTTPVKLARSTPRRLRKASVPASTRTRDGRKPSAGGPSTRVRATNCTRSTWRRLDSEPIEPFGA